jgi:ribosome-associated toxin RatA of RatAB toxin-antitoxin module
VARIEREIVVSCPPERVLDVVSNVERLPEFSEMTVAVRNSPGRSVRIGDRFEQVVKVAGVELETNWEVTDMSSSPSLNMLRVDGTSTGDGSATVIHEDDAETILANLKELCERTP